MSLNLEVIQNLLRNFQKIMKEKESTIRGQWNCLTLLEKLSQVQLCRRMNLFGVSASNIEVAQLFYYLGIKKNSMDYNDFINLMETNPDSLGPKTRRISQTKDIEHETLKAYENDYNKYCRRTTTLRSLFTAPGPTRGSYASEQTQKTTTKAARPFTASTTQYPKNNNSRKSRKQNDVIRANPNRSNAIDEEDQYNAHNDQYNDDQYYSREDHHNCCSNTLGNSGTFSYEPCRTCLDRSLPRDLTTKQAREATLRSFSNTSIQRQEYDGVDVSKTLNRDSGIPVIAIVRKISEIAYTNYPSSWACFLKWRDPHHDLLDANDLRTGLKHDNNLVLCQADAQKVIDKYGGPMNHSTFAVMLHDGSQFLKERAIDDDRIF